MQMRQERTDPQTDKGLNTLENPRGRKSVENFISQVVAAYHKGMNDGIWKLMEQQEEEVKQESEMEEEMENWRTLVPDLGNTRARITQFKKTLYLYWLMNASTR